MPGLVLRPLNLGDEEGFIHAEAALSDYGFGFHYEPGMAWPSYVALLAQHARGLDLPDGHVPATFLVAAVGNEMVGRSSIRHELNDFLAEQGGHIGYAVMPRYRRQGYATEILRQSVIIARSLGVDSSLLVADADNVGSIRVIERCGGVYQDTLDLGEGPFSRYWIS